MNRTTIDATPLEAAACRLLIAAMRASERPGASVRFDYQHGGPRVGGMVYTRIDHSDLRGAGLTLSTARHTLADFEARIREIEQLTPNGEITPCD